jgi:hypothetical protein
LALAYKRYEDDDFLFCKIKINDSSTSALTDACARQGHAGLAKAARAPNEIALLGIGDKLTLEYGVVIIGQFGHGSS